MSGEITLFKDMNAGSLAEYLSDPLLAAAAGYNDDVSNFQSYPAISIKGGRFTLVHGDERSVMMRPDEPDSPATSLSMVMLRINDKARTYYEKAYDPNETPPPKPTCYSNDNIAPSELSLVKQSDKCATCKWAVFGTAIKQDGTAGKGTRCASNARIAVAAPDALNAPHILRVPPTSLRPLRDAIEVIRKRNIAYPVVIMKISFVPEEASPTLKFLPSGVLSRQDAAAAIAMREDSVVRAICGLDERAPAAVAAPIQQAPSVATPQDELGSALDGALAAAAAAEAPPKPATSTQPPASPAAPSPVAAAPAAVAGVASAPPATAPAVAPSPSQPAKSPTEPTVTVATGGVLDELSAMLGKLDG